MTAEDPRVERARDMLMVTRDSELDPEIGDALADLLAAYDEQTDEVAGLDMLYNAQVTHGRAHYEQMQAAEAERDRLRVAYDEQVGKVAELRKVTLDPMARRHVEDLAAAVERVREWVSYVRGFDLTPDGGWWEATGRCANAVEAALDGPGEGAG